MDEEVRAKRVVDEDAKQDESGHRCEARWTDASAVIRMAHAGIRPRSIAMHMGISTRMVRRILYRRELRPLVYDNMKVLPLWAREGQR
jgi:hypothetical protein